MIGTLLLLATITELVQLWVPARSFNPFDLVANVTGVAFGIVTILIEDPRSKIENRSLVLES